jgi:hypothetical protein
MYIWFNVGNKIFFSYIILKERTWTVDKKALNHKTIRREINSFFQS